MRTLSFLVLTLALPLRGAPPANSTDTSLRSVPADAWLVVRATDLDGLRKTAGQNAWCKLTHDPELAPVRAWYEANVVSGALKELGFDPLELAASVHDSATLFAAIDANSRPCAGLLVEPGAERAAFDSFVGKIEAQLASTQAASKESHAGVELRVFERADSAEKEEGGSVTHELLFGAGPLSGILFGESREAVLALARGVIDRSRAASAAADASVPAGLLASESFLEARRSGQSGRHLELYLDLQRVIAFAKAEKPPDADDEKLMQALGVPGLRWIHASGDVGAGESFDLELTLRLPDQGYLRRWAELFLPVPREAARILPRESVSIALYGYDVAALYRSAWELAGEIAPEAQKAGRAQYEQILQSMGGLDPEAHFIAQLSGEFATFSMPISEEEWKASPAGAMAEAMGGDAKGPRLGEAYVIGLKDPETVEVFVEDALALAPFGEAMDSDEFQGHTVHTLELGEITLSWAFTAHHGVFSLFPSAVRASLALAGEEPGASVLQDERFKPHFAASPRVSVLGVALTPEMLKASLSALEALSEMMGSATDLAESMGAGDSDEEASDEPDFPPPPIPDPAVIDRYFKGTIVSALAREAGVLRMTLSAR